MQSKQPHQPSGPSPEAVAAFESVPNTILVRVLEKLSPPERKKLLWIQRRLAHPSFYPWIDGELEKLFRVVLDPKWQAQAAWLYPPHTGGERAARVVSGGPMKIFADTKGEHFGIPEPIYQAFVGFARELWLLARVRAIRLEREKCQKTGEGRDAVACWFHGSCDQVYRIWLSMGNWPGRVKRYAWVRFNVGTFDPCFIDADSYHNWRLLVLWVLDLEGFDDNNHEEVYQWHRKHGLESKLFHSSEDIPKEYFDWVDSKARVRIHNWTEIEQLPPNTVYVGRSPKGEVNEEYPWGNPYKVKEHGLKKSLRLHDKYLERSPELVQRIKSELPGKNLACWCKLGEPCHADILLKIANENL
jgi:hypothetical protein